MKFDTELVSKIENINESKVWPEWLELFEKIKKVKEITGQDFKIRIPLNRVNNMFLGSDLPAWMYKRIERIDGDIEGYDYKPFYVSDRYVETNPDLNKPDYKMASLFLQYKDQIIEELNALMNQYLGTHSK
ncbi:MAG: hypothetical protein R2685_10705 [Candidatus Nitrosocosmicus sp.]|nr:hypothetical protein [Candidatus Nitrosocosmicus sp.]